MRLTVLFLCGLFSALGQQPGPFSHRLHLKLQLKCARCHTAAETSTRADDNLLPKREVCLECHREAQIGQPVASRVVHFSHQLHLKMGNLAPVIVAAIDSHSYLSDPGNLRSQLNTKNACDACHRELEDSDRVTAANMPRMADCLVCHNKVDPPFSCDFCHAKDASLKPSNHTPDFLDTHTSGKLGLDKTTCAVCHGRRFTCLGCH